MGPGVLGVAAVKWRDLVWLPDTFRCSVRRSLSEVFKDRGMQEPVCGNNGRRVRIYRTPLNIGDLASRLLHNHGECGDIPECCIRIDEYVNLPLSNKMDAPSIADSARLRSGFRQPQEITDVPFALKMFQVSKAQVGFLHPGDPGNAQRPIRAEGSPTAHSPLQLTHKREIRHAQVRDAVPDEGDFYREQGNATQEVLRSVNRINNPHRTR